MAWIQRGEGPSGKARDEHRVATRVVHVTLHQRAMNEPACRIPLSVSLSPSLCPVAGAAPGWMRTHSFLSNRMATRLGAVRNVAAVDTTANWSAAGEGRRQSDARTCRRDARVRCKIRHVRGRKENRKVCSVHRVVQHEWRKRASTERVARIEQPNGTSQMWSHRSPACIRGIPATRTSHDRAFRSPVEGLLLPTCFPTSNSTSVASSERSRSSFTRRVFFIVKCGFPPTWIHPRRFHRRQLATTIATRPDLAESIQIARA